jgi:pimeloyl-ACP methyl ester carboxylesterase
MALNFTSLSCEPYPGSVNYHGETELIEGVEFTHWFTSVLRSRYHFVTAGDPEKPVLIFLHGLPESWYAFHYQMCALADEYFCIGIDLKGYGQSEKAVEEEYSFPHCAFEIGLLVDKLGIQQFSVVAHDRGSVLADHLCNLPNGFNQRITKYARLQQSANHPHAEPRPPHGLFSSSVGSLLFSSPSFPTNIYAPRPVSAPPEAMALKVFGTLEALKVPLSWRKALFQKGIRKGSGGDQQGYQLTHGVIPDNVIERIHREFHFPGVADAVPLTFRLTDFDKEYEDRINFLFDKMTMQVCFIQGALDPGQPRSDYEGIKQVRSNFSIRWIEDAGHFLHLEQPEAVNDVLKQFLREG